MLFYEMTTAMKKLIHRLSTDRNGVEVWPNASN